MDSITNDLQKPIEYGYCHCGCGQKTRIARKNDTRYGHVKGEPVSFLRGHGNIGRPLRERFWEKVDKDEQNECWRWTGSKSGDGYGVIHVNGKMKYAHRVSWETKNGPIPDGLHVLHHCDNPACTNPDHFFLGTQADNMDDRERKERGAKGEKHGRSKLTEQDIPQIRGLCANGMMQKDVGALYGVSREAISFVVNHRSWAHID